jgi:hypothetical protein
MLFIYIDLKIIVCISESMLKFSYSNFAIAKGRNNMDEMAQVMMEMEERLEVALSNMEYGTELSQDDVDVIRAACGKPNNKRNNLLQDVFNDFGNVFGGHNASI